MTNTLENLTQLCKEWFAANRAKNNANNQERKLKEKIQIVSVQYLDSIPPNLRSNRPLAVEISDTEELIIEPSKTWTDEEVDPKKLFESDPEYFWSIVSVPKGVVIAKFGEKGAAKLMRTVTKTDFKMEKKKKTGVFPKESFTV